MLKETRSERSVKRAAARVSELAGEANGLMEGISLGID
jgi:hypothetical protein